MRLKPDKIERLARAVTRALSENPDLRLGESADKVTHLIKQVIADDLKAEENLENEARRMVDQIKDEVTRTGASYEKMVLKVKQKLAAERKMVI